MKFLSEANTGLLLSSCGPSLRKVSSPTSVNFPYPTSVDNKRHDLNIFYLVVVRAILAESIRYGLFSLRCLPNNYVEKLTSFVPKEFTYSSADSLNSPDIKTSSVSSVQVLRFLHTLLFLRAYWFYQSCDDHLIPSFYIYSATLNLCSGPQPYFASYLLLNYDFH